MPASGEEESVVLRIHAEGHVRLTEIRSFLDSFEHAYNSILLFDRGIRQARGDALLWERLLLIDPMRRQIVSSPFIRQRITQPPSPYEISNQLPLESRAILYGVRLESPGFWDFLGKLNPMEVIREYLKDRHERRKDENYREAAEAAKLKLENRILENKVIRERIQIARDLGATDQDLAPLLNELIHRPLRSLNEAQDRGVINTAEIVAAPLETDTAPGARSRSDSPKHLG
ncbi:MAG TPA: hypothetical protein VMP11_03575, partial [Verrucomicrobiae bacterium]|nr:hypothetical protein [Verrucomicrobiae bacterium]